MQLPLRTQDRFLSLETGSEDTTLSMQCLPGCATCQILISCDFVFYFIFLKRWLWRQQFFTGAMTEHKKVLWNYPEMTGMLFGLKELTLGLLERKGETV